MLGMGMFKKAPDFQQILDFVTEHPRCFGRDIIETLGPLTPGGRAQTYMRITNLVRRDCLRSYQGLGHAYHLEVTGRPLGDVRTTLVKGRDASIKQLEERVYGVTNRIVKLEALVQRLGLDPGETP
jgi:hypothetical protein